MADVPVKRNSKGIWYCRPYLGTDSSGRKIQPQKTFPAAHSEAEARILAAEWIASLTADGRVRSMELADVLDDYIDMCELNGYSPNTIRQWRSFNRSYIKRFLRGRRADELTALDFTRFNGELLRHGGVDGSRLSPNTVNGVHQFLRGAYRYLTSVGIVEASPLIAAVAPRREAEEAVALGVDDVQALTGYIDPIVSLEREVPEVERKGALAVWIALHTGARIGEVCALRPRDIDRGRLFIHVGGTVVEPPREEPRRKEKPKSGKSRRNVSIVAEECDSLARYIDSMAGGPWMAPGVPLVSTDGTWTRPSNLSDWFKRLARRLDLDPAATFHTLRHTHASWCIAHGIDVVTLADRLGHASPTITMRIYGHLFEGRDRAAAETFYSALKGGD